MSRTLKPEINGFWSVKYESEEEAAYETILSSIKMVITK